LAVDNNGTDNNVQPQGPEFATKCCELRGRERRGTRETYLISFYAKTKW
jgi:hypothetical protein